MPADANAELLAAVLPLVLARLDGDVSALCACTCVCKRWNAALSHADQRSELLWRVLRVNEWLAPGFMDYHLLYLVKRTRGMLHSLDLSGCTEVPDGCILDALANQPHLAHFAAVGCNLESDELCNALKGRQLDSLRVRGMATGYNRSRRYDCDDRSSVTLVEPELAELRMRLKPTCQGNLDAVAGCRFMKRDEVIHGPDSNGMILIEDAEVCGVLCGEEDRACDFCNRAYRCEWHNRPSEDWFSECTCCERCHALICVDCKATHAGRVVHASGGTSSTWRCPSCL